MVQQMTDFSAALSRQVRIENEFGLHARAAGKIAGLVKNDANHAIWIIGNGNRADASSIIDMLTLGCEKGSRVTIAAEDSTDIDVLAAIERLVKNGFGE